VFKSSYLLTYLLGSTELFVSVWRGCKIGRELIGWSLVRSPPLRCHAATPYKQVVHVPHAFVHQAIEICTAKGGNAVKIGR